MSRMVELYLHSPMSSWHSAYLMKERDNCAFLLYLFCLKNNTGHPNIIKDSINSIAIRQNDFHQDIKNIMGVDNENVIMRQPLNFSKKIVV
jgi:hypothetical protein